ncbi:hypothetical protein BS47DRAFT_1360557 [Hydnum rufescens UP504]|uniref:Uncharacterized protein n=1 Tax=Hydnum rufescens UP504 TaxID=1448309 RepID=A0A9P6B3A3_9AGAM|nr:hypothetical protein BS47DRAFT_1360557 [Hydnum rufescens UP504]
MLGIESSGSDADADWDPAISTGVHDGENFSDTNNTKDVHVQSTGKEPSPVCSVAKKASPGPHGHGGRFSQAQLDEVEKHAELFQVAKVAGALKKYQQPNAWNLFQHQQKKLKKTPSGLRKGGAIIHQHLQPTYVKLHDELGGPSSDAWHEHHNTLIDDLSTEKASDTACISMSGDDALHQIGVHLVYLMVSDLASSTAAHGQNSINFNSEELRAWVDHEWNSCDTPEMKRPLASLYTYILEQKGVAEDLVKFCKDQDETTCAKEMKDQYTLWKAVSTDLLRMLWSLQLDYKTMPWSLILQKMRSLQIHCVYWPDIEGMPLLGTFGSNDLKTHHWQLLYYLICSTDVFTTLCFEQIGDYDRGDDDILVTRMNNVPLLTVWQAEGLQKGKKWSGSKVLQVLLPSVSGGLKPAKRKGKGSPKVPPLH